MAALAIIMAFVLGKGGAHGLNLSPFSPHYSTKGWGGIGYGMIFGFSGFAGFEAAAALGRETRNPTRAIPKAFLFSLIGAGLFFIFFTYCLSIGSGVTMIALCMTPSGFVRASVKGSELLLTSRIRAWPSAGWGSSVT